MNNSNIAKSNDDRSNDAECLSQSEENNDQTTTTAVSDDVSKTGPSGVNIDTTASPTCVDRIPSEEQKSTSISESGRYALTAICSLSLHQLFPNKWDATFNMRAIRYIITNLQMQKSEPIMLELTKGKVFQSYDPYVKLLRAEPIFETEESFQSILFELVTLAVHDGKYDSRWRVLIQHLATLFNVEPLKVDEYERKLVNCLLQKTSELSAEEQSKVNDRRLTAKFKRYTIIGLAAIGGGALMGITGGLAAPMIGAGLSTILGSSAIFTAIGSSAGAAIVGSLFGVAGGQLTGYKMKKRVGDIEEFEFHELIPSKSDILTETRTLSINTLRELHVTIAISGWINHISEENYTKPWKNLLNGREQYYLKYESSYLLELGKAMEYIVKGVASFATQEALKFTVLNGLVAAIAWPAWLLSAASVIDNPWGVCLRRSAQVGKQLAEVLLTRSQGHRPVTLVGFSLGARVIFYCLKEMSERENCEGIIQDVVLIGAPCTAQKDEWSKFRRVVAGRIINAYSRGDWILKFLYRTISIAIDGVAGLQNIQLDDPKMHNFDLTDMVAKHGDYPERMTDILVHIGLPVVIT